MPLKTDPFISKAKAEQWKRYQKQVNKDFAKVELLVKVIIVPAETLVSNYRNFVGEGTESDFVRIMDLKGINKKDQAPLLESYRASDPSRMGFTSPNTTPTAPGALRKILTLDFKKEDFTNFMSSNPS